MKSEICISIIIPIYNVENYLAECLDSILDQSFCDYEMICIDDMSTDHSYEILQEYGSKFSQIKILRNTVNRGLSYTRNRGMKEAVGKYIMFVDSDDLLKQGSLERIRQLLDEYKDIDILYYDMEIRNEGKWAKEQIEGVLKPVDEITGKVYMGQELFVQWRKKDAFFITAWRQIVRRNFLEESNIFFYEDIYHEDYLYSFYCALNAKKVVYIPEEFYIYRRRDASIVSTMNLKRVQSYFIIFIELWNYWKNGNWSADVNWLFADFLGEIYTQFMHYLNYYPNERLEDLGDLADQFMYDLLAESHKMPYKHITDSGKLIRNVKDASKIFVYGAGNVGIEVIQLLHSKGIVIDSIYVSDKQSNPDAILGVPVMEFGECVIDENALVIIAILQENEKAISSVVKKLRSATRAKLLMYDGTVI